MSICKDIDPFDTSECDVEATWRMTSELPLYKGPELLCERHKQITEKMFAKYHPHVRVTFERINPTESHAEKTQ